jgi:signal transduction histidine kinase
MSSTSFLQEAGRASERDGHGLVDAERLRIARELHDVVAYSFATINVQAGAAVHVMDDRPEQMAEALRAIKAVSAEAARELRAILGVLRRVDGAEAERQSGEPARLGRLDDLAETMTSAGLPTRVVISGRPRPLPTAVDLAAYRIVQEALTNALRHAGPASATVSVTYKRDRVTVTIVDDGQGDAPAGPERSAGNGHGIAGMRERVVAFGGELEAGLRRFGGFRVSASLPLLVEA